MRGSRGSNEELEWKVLLNPTAFKRLDPWKVKLVPLLRQFSAAFRSTEVTFTHAGIVVLTASTVHREKSERLEVEEERPKLERPDLIVPPPLELPVRGDVISATLLDVVKALRTVLVKMQSDNSSKFEQINVDIKLDDYLIRIEEEFNAFVQELAEFFADKQLAPLLALIEGLDRLTAVKRIILLLFAASRGYVDLIQEESDGRVLVMWGGEGASKQA
ncbi:MAG: hypothetical protein NZ988_02470 [Thaumarchaeota archaeon]|nr:hypothetical protein [Candidatus Calditenuaceae archaeon]MDW8186900.1 hypothetical protein [Nitrososphaerota archaeon]